LKEKKEEEEEERRYNAVKNLHDPSVINKPHFRRSLTSLAKL
jgi:hypothetical protein